MDISTMTIKRLFDRQIKELTRRTCQSIPKEEFINVQFSGGWLRWILRKELNIY